MSNGNEWISRYNQAPTELAPVARVKNGGRQLKDFPAELGGSGVGLPESGDSKPQRIQSDGD